ILLAEAFHGQLDGRLEGRRFLWHPPIVTRPPRPSRIGGMTDETWRDPEALRREVEQIKWWHRIDLGRGLVTPGVDVTPQRLAEIRMPDTLAGLSVLDIGAWDGFFSFEAERRGARRILAIDRWPESGWGNPAGFFLARQVLGSKVEYARMDLFEITPERLGRFDLVLFMGVLYHLR